MSVPVPRTSEPVRELQARPESAGPGRVLRAEVASLPSGDPFAGGRFVFCLLGDVVGEDLICSVLCLKAGFLCPKEVVRTEHRKPDNFHSSLSHVCVAAVPTHEPMGLSPV